MKILTTTTENIMNELKKMMCQGYVRHKICRELGISSQTYFKVLKENPEIHKIRREKILNAVKNWTGTCP